jgi:urease accessory protein
MASAAPLGRPGRGGGLIQLRLARDPEGRTRPLCALARPPLQLSRVRYDLPSRPNTAVHTLLTLGGVLEGDRNQIVVDLDPGAHAQIVMAAATQVLRMPDGHAEQSLDIRMGAGSRLTWLGEPTILFAGAALLQETAIALAPGARLALLDILVPGRLARGELHQFRMFQGALTIRDAQGGTLAYERAALEPARWSPGVAGVLGRAPVLGSLLLLGDTLDAEQIATTIGAAEIPDLGATTLPNQAGVLVRAIGHAPSEVRARLAATLRAWA